MAAEQLRQAVGGEGARRVEEGGGNLVQLVDEAVTLQAGGDDAVVVWPYGADVVAERVVSLSIPL